MIDRNLTIKYDDNTLFYLKGHLSIIRYCSLHNVIKGSIDMITDNKMGRTTW